MIPIVNKNENRINIYPNPSKGDVNISVSENSTIKIIDLTGRIIAIYDVIENFVLNLTQSAGVYFVQVENKNGISIHKLVIVK